MSYYYSNRRVGRAERAFCAKLMLNFNSTLALAARPKLGNVHNPVNQRCFMSLQIIVCYKIPRTFNHARTTHKSF